MAKVILGSQSPRRKEILNYFSLPFTQVSPTFDEDSIPFEMNPSDYVLKLSEGKASSLASTYSDAIILTADTIVFKDGKMYGKPKDTTEAIEYLTALSGEWHSVFTGLTVIYRNQTYQKYEETRVQLNTLFAKQIEVYAKIHSLDKAGGYAIQSSGSLIVKKIEGCYHNVMGLPINSLCQLLNEVGIDLWDYLD